MIKKTFEKLNVFERNEMYDIRTKFIFSILDILEKHKIDCFFDCGTLLGAYRDKQYIPWDSDADIGVLGEQFSKECLEELINTFNIVDERRELDDYKFFKLVLRDENGENFRYKKIRMECDVYFYYPDGKFRLMKDFWHSWIHPVPAICLDKLDNIEWYGRTVNIPSNTELYLKQWYGDDWHTPIKTQNVSPNRYKVKDWEKFKREELEDILDKDLKNKSSYINKNSSKSGKLF